MDVCGRGGGRKSRRDYLSCHRTIPEASSASALPANLGIPRLSVAWGTLAAGRGVRVTLTCRSGSRRDPRAGGGRADGRISLPSHAAADLPRRDAPCFSPPDQSAEFYGSRDGPFVEAAGLFPVDHNALRRVYHHRLVLLRL